MTGTVRRALAHLTPELGPMNLRDLASRHAVCACLSV
jgi:hypothetical protein